jgi:uncharacterized protein with PIN domain
MLGRLAKWLRLLGYDTAYDNHATDHELARRARAEGRLLLTCDRELAARRGLKTLLIRSQQLEDQVRQVQEALGPPPEPSLSRCSLCNTVLQEITAREVADRVPRYVLEANSEFHYCPRCGRIYWPGSHVEAIEEQLDQFGT